MSSDIKKTRSVSAVGLISVPESSSRQVDTAPLSVPIFAYSIDDFIYDLNEIEINYDPGLDDLKTLLMLRWDKSKQHKSMNYSLNCMYKLLPGGYNLSMQLNIERGQLRRRPMRFRHLNEPFNKLRWNFTKIRQSEILLYLKCIDQPLTTDPLDRHLIIVNASPLERGHSLLVPSINKCCPQVSTNITIASSETLPLLTPQALCEISIRQSVHLMLLIKDDSFHVLFNSLLGFASVNHLHLHVLFWPYDSELINRRVERVNSDVHVIREPDWFISIFVFQLKGAEDLDAFIRRVYLCVQLLTSRDVAHNVFFSRAQPLRTEGAQSSEDRFGKLPSLVTAYVFPRRSVTGAKPPTNFCPAACELAGCLTSYSKLDSIPLYCIHCICTSAWRFFESATELSALRIIVEEACLGSDHFERLVSSLVGTLNGINISDEMDGQCPLRGAELGSSYDEQLLTCPEKEELFDSFRTFPGSRRAAATASAVHGGTVSTLY